MNLKQILILAVFLVCCGAPQKFDNFKNLELFLGNSEVYDGVVRFHAAASNVSFSIDENSGCFDSFDISEAKVEELRSMLSGFNKITGNSISQADGLVITVDGRHYYKPSEACSDCSSFSSADFCQIQTFLKDLIEDSGFDTSVCDADLYDDLLDC